MTNKNEDLLKSKIDEGLIKGFQIGEKEHITSLELVEQINLFRKQEKGSSCKLMTHSSLFSLIEYEFEEEIDECEMSPIFVKNKKGEDVEVYPLSFKQARQVLMFETRFVRKQVISYIECLENAYEGNTSIRLMQNYISVLGDLTLAEKENTKLREKNKAMLHKVKFYDAIVGSDNLFDMKQVADRLSVTGFNGETLINFLREQNVITEDNRPYQHYMDEGYFKLIEIRWTDFNSAITFISTKTMILQRGVEFIDKLVKQKFNK
jgi:hypothetical protein|nr:MAG TPA: KilAC domain protein [Caudoviricetes sp.]